MNYSLGSVFIAWGIVHAGLSTFFFIAASRVQRRGHRLFAASLLGIAAMCFARAIAQTTDSGGVLFLTNRLSVIVSAFGPVLHTHFLIRNYRFRALERKVWFFYAIALGVVLADLGSVAYELALGGARGASVPLELFTAILLGAHLLLDGALLGLRVRSGDKLAKWPLTLLLLLGPLVVFDVFMGVTTQVDYFFSETLIWLYSLCMIGVQLAQLRGTEGLLARTTSSLEETTAELQVSYAELELMSTELSRKEQLAAVGELAAAIAHEVRNPLAIIMNASSGLRRKNLAEEDRATLLHIVDEEAARLNQLVTELLRFARPVHAALAPSSLLDICEGLRNDVSDGYELVVENLLEGVAAGPQAVSIDPGLFRLALDNLMSNATLAMASGGTVRITLRQGKLADGMPAAAIDVLDDGVGMGPDELAKAAKPFFTTRPRGTGLGLAIVERIMDAHGGEMKISSEAGAGTTVTLLVPVDEVAPKSPKYPGSRSPSQRRRHRSVPAIAETAKPPSSFPATPESRKRRLSFTGEMDAPPPLFP